MGAQEGVEGPCGMLKESLTCTENNWAAPAQWQQAELPQDRFYFIIIFYSLSGTVQARRRAWLLPLVGQTSSVKPEEPRGWWGETRGKEAEQLQRDKEKEMEANIRV